MMVSLETKSKVRCGAVRDHRPVSRWGGRRAPSRRLAQSARRAGSLWRSDRSRNQRQAAATGGTSPGPHLAAFSSMRPSGSPHALRLAQRLTFVVGASTLLVAACDDGPDRGDADRQALGLAGTGGAGGGGGTAGAAAGADSGGAGGGLPKGGAGGAAQAGNGGYAANQGYCEGKDGPAPESWSSTEPSPSFGCSCISIGCCSSHYQCFTPAMLVDRLKPAASGGASGAGGSAGDEPPGACPSPERFKEGGFEPCTGQRPTGTLPPQGDLCCYAFRPGGCCGRPLLDEAGPRIAALVRAAWA